MRYISTAVLGLIMGVVTAFAALSEPWDRQERLTAPTFLIGTGCTGPSSVIVGEEESDFPICDRIERHYLPQ